jgi:hypothetical protein
MSCLFPNIESLRLKNLDFRNSDTQPTCQFHALQSVVFEETRSDFERLFDFFWSLSGVAKGLKKLAVVVRRVEGLGCWNDRQLFTDLIQNSKR